MFLLIDKPKGKTSHDVVNVVRRITGERKVGHAGTLDPNATGLLIVAVERGSTKRISEFVKKNKVYEAEIFLGEERDTGDVEGKVVEEGVGKEPTRGEVEEVLKQFEGESMQEPPIYSAIKVGGRKAYEVARKGGEIELPSRKVEIYSIELIEYDYPILRVRTKVSSGTYIRSLARDIGRNLKTYGYLKNLRRTAIGKYSVEDAVSLGKLNKDNWRMKAFDI